MIFSYSVMALGSFPCWTNFSAWARTFTLLKPNPSAIKISDPKLESFLCRGKPEIRAIGAKVPQKNGETQAVRGNRWCMSAVYPKGSGCFSVRRKQNSRGFALMTADQDQGIQFLNNCYFGSTSHPRKSAANGSLVSPCLRGGFYASGIAPGS